MKLLIHTDGGARGNPGPAGAGVVIAGEHGKILARYKKYLGETTNNSAEYQALILALEKALKLGGTELKIRMDSELIVKQMKGEYKIKDKGLKPLASEVLKLLKHFKAVSFTHIPREQNELADLLVNEAIDEVL